MHLLPVFPVSVRLATPLLTFFPLPHILLHPFCPILSHPSSFLPISFNSLPSRSIPQNLIPSHSTFTLSTPISHSINCILFPSFNSYSPLSIHTQAASLSTPKTSRYPRPLPFHPFPSHYIPFHITSIPQGNTLSPPPTHPLQPSPSMVSPGT